MYIIERFPKFGIYNIFGLLLVDVGQFLFLLSFLAYKLRLEIDVSFWIYVGFSFILGSFWCLPVFLAEQMAEDLAVKTSLAFVKRSEQKIIQYKETAKVLTNFLFYYFTLFQILSVTIIFSGISQLLVSSVEFNIETIINLLGPSCLIG